jgi:hypothetical protein
MTFDVESNLPVPLLGLESAAASFANLWDLTPEAVINCMGCIAIQVARNQGHTPKDVLHWADIIWGFVPKR